MASWFRQSLAIALVLGMWQNDFLRCDAAEAEAEAQWIVLTEGEKLAAWRMERQGWRTAADVSLDPVDEKRLVATAGHGVIWSQGDAENLLTKDEFRDVELKLEFLTPKESNSGVKLNGLYEIQIRDTYGVEKLRGDDCGGVYPRAKLEPEYQLLDDGAPPLENAARPAGQWQQLELSFVAPRFDAQGEKIANGRFEEVKLNGKLIHKSVELKWPTGHAWNTQPEVPQAPLLLQGDHGPIAFRDIRIRRVGE